MSDVELVIKIPKETYIHLHSGGNIGASLLIENAIKNGTPLKQEPCEDAISREEALSMISCHFLLEDDKDKTEYEFAYEDGIKTAYEDVRSLPPVNPQPKKEWIPIGEDFPKTEQYALLRFIIR
jgi:hypothetical protein